MVLPCAAELISVSAPCSASIGGQAVRETTGGDRRDVDVPANDDPSDGWQVQGSQAFGIDKDVDLDDQSVDHGETHDGAHTTVHDGQ